MEEMLGPIEEVFKDLRLKWKEFQEQEPFLDVVKGFVAAIDWTEPWIIGILALHVVLIGAAILARRNTTLQGGVSLIAVAIVFNAERLNRLGKQHWQRFARQDYFDASGVFMSAVVSGPLLLVMFIVLINYLLACSQMLVQAKRKELIYKAKQRAKQQNGQAGEGKKAQ